MSLGLQHKESENKPNFCCRQDALQHALTLAIMKSFRILGQWIRTHPEYNCPNLSNWQKYLTKVI